MQVSLNQSIMETYAAMYAARLNYISPAGAYILDGEIIVSLSVSPKEWAKVQEEVATWGTMTPYEHRLEVATKEGKMVVVLRKNA